MEFFYARVPNSVQGTGVLWVATEEQQALLAWNETGPSHSFRLPDFVKVGTESFSFYVMVGSYNYTLEGRTIDETTPLWHWFPDKGDFDVVHRVDSEGESYYFFHERPSLIGTPTSINSFALSGGDFDFVVHSRKWLKGGGRYERETYPPGLCSLPVAP